jgi:hypothetical protein
MITRACSCGTSADGVPLPDLLGEGWSVWHNGDTYLTCPDCSVTIEQLEYAVAGATPVFLNTFNERKL